MWVRQLSLNYFDIMVLDCLEKIDAERSQSAVFHLLKGKRSSQTIQDAGLFQIAKYFGMVPDCSRSDITASLKKLKQLAFVKAMNETDTYRVTAEGAQELKRALFARPWPAHCHGAYHQQAAKIFWKRFSLLVQVLSNKQHHCQRYTPITKDNQILQWVKSYLRLHPDHNALSASVWGLITDHLNKLSEKQAFIFVYSLTSYERIGYTNRQLADSLLEDERYVYILFWGAVHYFIQSIPHCEHSVLADLLSDTVHESALTQSARKTLHLVQKGFPIERIADIRNLKTATIEDHIVEISLHQPSFFIEQYISKEEQQRIVEFAKNMQTNKMKRIREGLHQQFSYFQIRLALAKTVSQYE